MDERTGQEQAPEIGRLGFAVHGRSGFPDLASKRILLERSQIIGPVSSFPAIRFDQEQ
jgi:hypothetical protein